MPDGGMHYPALVLNADFRPLSYFPLSVWAWQDAVKAVFLDRVSVLNEYEVAVRSPSHVDAAAQRDRAEGLYPRGPPPGLHPVQRVPARRLLLPVLPRPAAHARPDVRPRDSPQPRRTDHVGERRHRVRLLQSAQGLPPAARVPHASAPCAPAALDMGAAGERPRLSRRTTCTRAGGTTCIGTRSCWTGSRRRSRATPTAPPIPARSPRSPPCSRA